MLFLHENKKQASFFGYCDDWNLIQEAHMSRKGILHILWNRTSHSKSVYCDDQWIVLPANSIATLTSFYHLKMSESSKGIVSFFFNREFYCLRDHDHEISCNGILFFGAQSIPLIIIPQDKRKMFESLWNVFMDEFKIQDIVQNEMLLALLKRLIIQITRIAKESFHYNQLEPSRIDTVRKFHMLVDEHYKAKKKVSDYSLLMGIAAKTLTNIMLVAKQESPLQVIHNRIILEIKRLLLYSNKALNEISTELQFEDIGQMAKLFKKKTGFSPIEFRRSILKMQEQLPKGNPAIKKGKSDIYRLN